MKTILLTQGKAALVDDADFAYLSQWNWTAQKFSRKTSTLFYYATSTVKIGTRQLRMHEVLMKTEDGQLVDHIDGDGLNNRRENLRLSTKSLNGLNRNVLASNNTSGVTGVTWNKALGKWQAQVMFKRKHIHLGLFTSIPPAAKVVKEFKEAIFLQDAQDRSH